MKILYLCSRKYYDTKMSRGRFHYIEAITNSVDKLKTWGNKWSNYNSESSINENLKKLSHQYDWIIIYQPREYIGVEELNNSIFIYNEMYNPSKITSDLNLKPAIVICHHYNEMMIYVNKYPKIRFVNIPHCSDKRYFFDYKLDKDIDVLLIGRCSKGHYPLRTRIKDLIIDKKFPKKYNILIHNHPGYNINQAYDNEQVIQYAKKISRSKICVFCSGIPRTRYAKYVEVAMCGSVICADIPNEDHTLFQDNIIVIDNKMTDKEIINKITSYLDDSKKLEDIRSRGINAFSKFTTEYYADKFINALNI